MTLIFNLQKWVIIFATAVLGAGIIIGSFTVLFNPVARFMENPVQVMLQTSPLLMFLFLALVILGIIVQARTSRSVTMAASTAPAVPAAPPAPSAGAAAPVSMAPGAAAAGAAGMAAVAYEARQEPAPAAAMPAEPAAVESPAAAAAAAEMMSEEAPTADAGAMASEFDGCPCRTGGDRQVQIQTGLYRRHWTWFTPPS